MQKSWILSTGEEAPDPWSTFVVVCETCGNILLYDNPCNTFDEETFQHATLMYPKEGKLHESVPELVCKVYEEAYRIREIAPNAFAVQIRRALEAICEDQGEKKGNLVAKLGNLSKSGKLPPVVSEASDILRLLGNIGAHGLSDSVHQLQVYALDDFFRVIIEYLYVAPSKIESFKNRSVKF